MFAFFGMAVSLSGDSLVVVKQFASAYVFTGARGNALNQSWTLDGVGNWSSNTLNGTTQAREHTKANEISTINGSSSDVAQDSAGNVTMLPRLVGNDEQKALLYGGPTPRLADWMERVNAVTSKREPSRWHLSLSRSQPFGDDAWMAQTVKTLHVGYTVHGEGGGQYGKKGVKQEEPWLRPLGIPINVRPNPVRHTCGRSRGIRIVVVR